MLFFLLSHHSAWGELMMGTWEMVFLSPESHFYIILTILGTWIKWGTSTKMKEWHLFVLEAGEVIAEGDDIFQACDA